MPSYAEVGARNNAEWCDIVCRSHGIATRLDANLVGGAIANQSVGVVEVSNVYAVGRGVSQIWAGAVAALSQLYPGAVLVGYESGADLDAARAQGFVVSGPLRVWVL